MMEAFFVPHFVAGPPVNFRQFALKSGCGGLGGENPAAFPQARPIFQQPFSLPESDQTLAGIAFHAAGKSGNHFPAASKFARKPFQHGISDSHSLLKFSEISVNIRELLNGLRELTAFAERWRLAIAIGDFAHLSCIRTFSHPSFGQKDYQGSCQGSALGFPR